MKDITEELKYLKENESRQAPTLSELEELAESMSNDHFNKYKKSNSKISRFFPECYNTFTYTNIQITNFHEETLFFIFYALVESTMQLNAYNELISRGYYFSKTFDGFVFLEDQKIVDNRRRKVLCFDPFEWEKIAKDVCFDETFINGLVGKVPETE